MKANYSFSLFLMAAVAVAGPKPGFKLKAADETGIRTLRPDAQHVVVAEGEVAGIVASGGRVVSALGDGRVLVNSNSAFSPVGAWAIDSESKISADLMNTGYFLVSFHDDVQDADAQTILDRSGLALKPHPDLLAHQFLVAGTDEQAHAAAKWDEVAYVYPASQEIVDGQPVSGCAGPLTDFGTVGQYIATFGDGWDGPGRGKADLTYSFSQMTEKMPRSVVQAAVEQALAEWSRVADLHFRYTEETSGSRNINILFASGSHGDPFAFDGRGRVLAHTFYPPPVNTDPAAGDLHLDDDESWQNGGEVDFYSVLLHELGHALGLGHSDRPTAVMYPYYRRTTSLQDDDIAAIRKLYAEAGSPESNTVSPAEAIGLSLTVAQPTPGNASTVSLQGSTVGGTGTIRVRWTSALGAGVADGGRTWTARSIPLSLGENLFTIIATDASGSSVTRTVVVSRSAGAAPTPQGSGTGAKDTTAPTITITSPSSGIYSTSAASVRITGSARDNTGVTGVTWTSSNGRSGTATGTSTWSFELPLYVGDNPVVVRAADAAGNVGWRNLTITRR